jgi:hypothetical protein
MFYLKFWLAPLSAEERLAPNRDGYLAPLTRMTVGS